jgi:hypothetical protein
MIQNGPNQPPRDDGDPTLGRVRIGEPFNPWHKVCGFFPPEIVVRQRAVTRPHLLEIADLALRAVLSRHPREVSLTLAVLERGAV